jgi:hypothetical protein
MGRDLAPLVAPFRASAPMGVHDESRYEIRSDCDEPRQPYTLFYGGEELSRGRAARDFAQILTWHVNQSVIAASVDRYVLLHASAATRAGITVILPADMESGKTTTVAGLLRAGFEYVTDEAVAIDPATGMVTPFPKTLSLDPGSWPLFPECRPGSAERLEQWHVTPQQLGAQAASSGVAPPRVVVFPRYVPGSETLLLPLSKGDAVHELARMTFAFAKHPVRNLSTLKQISVNASVARLVIGSLDGAVDAIENLVSQRLLEDM